MVVASIVTSHKKVVHLWLLSQFQSIVFFAFWCGIVLGLTEGPFNGVYCV